MNVCLISGMIQKNAIVRGKKNKALVFTVVTLQQPNGDSESGIPNYVPCVIWNPPDELVERLTTEGEGAQIELQGRVSSSRHEANGEPRSNAEVIVYTKSFKVL